MEVSIVGSVLLGCKIFLMCSFLVMIFIGVSSCRGIMFLFCFFGVLGCVFFIVFVFFLYVVLFLRYFFISFVRCLWVWSIGLGKLVFGVLKNIFFFLFSICWIVFCVCFLLIWLIIKLLVNFCDFLCIVCLVIFYDCSFCFVFFKLNVYDCRVRFFNLLC